MGIDTADAVRTTTSCPRARGATRAVPAPLPAETTARVRVVAANTLAQFVDTLPPYPDDGGDPPDEDTNRSRRKPYDWVLADADLEQFSAPVEVGGLSFPNGLVFTASSARTSSICTSRLCCAPTATPRTCSTWRGCATSACRWPVRSRPSRSDRPTPSSLSLERIATDAPEFTRRDPISATPGRYAGERAGTVRVVITEMSDAQQFEMEFVELLYDAAML